MEKRPCQKTLRSLPPSLSLASGCGRKWDEGSREGAGGRSASLELVFCVCNAYWRLCSFFCYSFWLGPVSHLAEWGHLTNREARGIRSEDGGRVRQRATRRAGEGLNAAGAATEGLSLQNEWACERMSDGIARRTAPNFNVYQSTQSCEEADSTPVKTHTCTRAHPVNKMTTSICEVVGNNECN